MSNSLILGPIRVERLTVDAALKMLDDALETKSPKRVAFCNAHSVSQALSDVTYRAALSRMLVFNDGVALDIVSRLITGKPFPANLNGTDFIPAFLARSRRPLRIGLLGGKPGVAHRAAKSLATRYPQHRIVFVRNGYFAAEQEQEIVASIANEAPDVLLVAMGNPLQELFMHRNAQALNCKLVFGVGALLDFLSETVPRAPFWMRKARLEWLFRLKNEPRRLMRRYTLGAVTFAWAVLVFRIKGALYSH